MVISTHYVFHSLFKKTGNIDLILPPTLDCIVLVRNIFKIFIVKCCVVMSLIVSKNRELYVCKEVTDGYK